jgi:hypothetical protein
MLPDGLPTMIYWRLRTPGVVLTSVFDKAIADLAESRDHDGNMANHTVCRRYRPWGATGWRTRPSEPWQPMETCPVPATVKDDRQGGVAGKPQQSKYGR